MAQQSARRGRKNQGNPPCFVSTLRVMWFRSANSHTGPQPSSLHQRPDRWQHPTTCQILQIPLALLGASTDGVWIPSAILPGWMQTIGACMPSFHLGQIARAIVGADTIGTVVDHALILAAMTAAAAGWAWTGWRRSPA